MDRNGDSISFQSTAAAAEAPSTTTTTNIATNKTQTLVFIRHGIAVHNITQNYSDPNMIDSPLVNDGKVRSIQTGIDVKNWFRKQQHNTSTDTGTGTGKIDLFITSPLTRCIQTMTIAFLPGDEYDNENDNDSIKDCNTSNNTDSSTNIIIKPVIPIICHENVREAYGINYPDKRRSKSLLKKYWPLIDFDTVSMNNSNDDELWNNRTQRETLTDVIQRIQNFIEYWLIIRSETNIVIITHGVWIECLLRHYINNNTVSSLSSDSHSLLQRRVYNLDCISCQCHSKLISTPTSTCSEQQQQQQPQYEFVKLDQFELISTQYK